MARPETGAEGARGIRQRAAHNRLAALVDDWVTSVEQGLTDPEEDLPGDDPDPTSIGLVPDSDAPVSRPRIAGEATDQPLSPTATEPPPTAGGESAGHEVRETLASVSIDGPVVTFSDSLGGRIALSRGDLGLRHLGSVAVRGPAAPPPAAFQERAPGPAAGQAFEFVAGWFGSPFDAVNARVRPGTLLEWGCWNFSGARLAAALAMWRRASPDLFASQLEQYGLGVTQKPADDSESWPQSRRGTRLPYSVPTAGARPAWELVVHEGRGTRWCGRRAAALVAQDPRRLAALARAGRERGAQLAQIDAAVDFGVRAALALPWPAPSGALPASEVLQTPRELAVLFFLVLRFGLRGTRHLVHRVIPDADDRAIPEASWPQRLVDTLAAGGAGRQAQQVLRILTSPELDS